jgi:hypothetical protein
MLQVTPAQGSPMQASFSQPLAQVTSVSVYWQVPASHVPLAP